jgi:hypothetical protein
MFASRMRRLIIASLGFVAISPIAEAGLITPVDVSTNDPVVFGDLANLIDGVVDVDQNAGIGGSVSGLFRGPYTVSFELGAAFDLTGMRLWNNAGNIDNDGEGIDAFTLRFLDAGASPLGEYSSNATDTLAMQEFGFESSGVQTVELVIESNHAPMIRNYAALYEVAFVPSPSVGAVFIAGILTRRRRR